MPVDRHSEDADIIRQLTLISTVSKAKFTALCKVISVEQAESGAFLFKQGDTENDLIYLLDGRITLQTDEFKVETIESGTESARFAIAHQIPRKIDALAESNIRFLRLNANFIKSMQNTSNEEESSYMIVDDPEDNDNDWMTTLLKSPIFRALPPANLQSILMALEEISFKKDETIIAQGEPGDFYYLIKNGKCQITRKPSPNAKAIKLGELRSQDTFGEDSLLSGDIRNVSVVALTDVSLLKLNKNNFINLIETPSLKFIDYQQAQNEIAKGTMLMDVRPLDEYQKHHLPNSTNIPFFSLRMNFKTLNKKRPVIVVCENENTSKAAAFFLLKNKINASILVGGMEKVPDQAFNNEVSNFNEDDIEISADTQTGGVSLINEVEIIKNPPNEIETDVSQLKQTISLLEKKCSTLATEKDAIETNVKQLNQKNSLLKEKCKTLTTEKEEAIRKYKELYEKTEKLKTMMESLK